MKFVFWQNVISIHQSAFLSSLSVEREVTLVVEKDMDEDRKSSGWNIPDMGNVAIIVSPDKKVISTILQENKDAIHVFSGIDAFPMVFFALKKSIALGLKIIVYLEPYYWLGFKGYFRRLKYRLLNIRYGKYIDAWLITGDVGKTIYLKSGFSSCKMFDWGYFTEIYDSTVNVEIRESTGLPRLLFVGNIDKRKNILTLVDVCKSIKNSFSHFHIVGDGSLAGVLEDKIKYEKNISYLGVKQNKDVQALMQSCDIFVLPSLLDGWGAVVNEALQNGMRVLASKNCGSSVLLDGIYRGESFYLDADNTDLKHILLKWLKKGRHSNEERECIRQWCMDRISGNAVSRYFVDFCHFLYNSGNKPNTPWKETDNKNDIIV